MQWQYYCLLLVFFSSPCMENLKTIKLIYDDLEEQLAEYETVTCLNVKAKVNTIDALKLSTFLSSQIEDCDDQEISCVITAAPNDPTDMPPVSSFIDLLRKCTLLSNTNETMSTEQIKRSEDVWNNLQLDLNRHKVPFLLSLLKTFHRIDAQKPTQVLIHQLNSRFEECVQIFAHEPAVFASINVDLNNELARVFAQGHKTHREFLKELKPKNLKELHASQDDKGELKKNFDLANIKVRWDSQDKAFIILTNNNSHNAKLAIVKDHLSEWRHVTYDTVIRQDNKLSSLQSAIREPGDAVYDIFTHGCFFWPNPEGTHIMLEEHRSYPIFPIADILKCDTYVLQNASMEQVMTLAFLNKKIRSSTFKKTENMYFAKRYLDGWCDKCEYTCEKIYRKFSNAHCEKTISWAKFPHLKEAYDSLDGSFKQTIETQFENTLPVIEPASCTIL